MTETTPNSLKQKSISAVAWSSADLFMRQGFQFVVAVILARLLSPEEFGTIALLYLFTSIASTFVDSGFSSALIQCKETTRADESTVFWFNLMMGAVMTLLLWFFAPLIAEFYKLPILIDLTRVLALTIVINSLGSVHQTMLTKSLDFKSIMKVGFGASLISGILAIYLAKNGYGIWALALQLLMSSFLNTFLLWAMSGWRPAWNFSIKSVRKLFGFGGYLMASALLDTLYSRAYTILIGKLYGVSQLGFYDRANNTQQVPANILSGIIARVAFPVFSAANHDDEKLRKGMRHAVRGVMLINVPIMLGLMVTAENLIMILFGDKWLAAIPLLEILCIAGIFWPLHVLNLNILKAQGHSSLFFKLEIIKKIVGSVFIVFGIFYFGVIGLAWSQVAFGFVGFCLNAFYTGLFLNYGAIRQMKDFLPIVLVSILMTTVISSISQYLVGPLFVVLIEQVVIGILIVVLSCVLFKLRAFYDCIDLFIKR